MISLRGPPGIPTHFYGATHLRGHATFEID